MPSAVSRDSVRLHYEEAGTGRSSFSCTNSPPTTPTGSRRCVTSHAVTAASPIPRAAIRRPTCRPDAAVYTYKHFYTDALAVLDHLGIARGAFRRPVDGLLFVAADRPPRARARAVDDARRRRRRARTIEQSRRLPRAVPGQRRAVSRRSGLGRGREGHPRGPDPHSVCCSRTRAATPTSTPRWRGMTPRARPTPCAASRAGSPSIYTLTDAIRHVPTPALDPVRRRGRQLHRAQPVPEAASAGGGAGVLSEVRPRAQSGRAGAVQRDGRALHRAWSRPGAGRCAIQRSLVAAPV